MNDLGKFGHVLGVFSVITWLKCVKFIKHVLFDYPNDEWDFFLFFKHCLLLK